MDIDDLFGSFSSGNKRKNSGLVVDSNESKVTKKSASSARAIQGATLGAAEIETVPKADMNETNSHIPAKTYPFQLDSFQQQAINYIERNESVLVAAHTSAGKTVVAEYAIAKSLKNKQRVIYTSPIKALSNQKYRDMEAEFSDVGLMTGDMTINPNATCLIMTTEILRSMLYRGSEIMREVAWVIYDEVHYMRDKERGVVWEESIILLPHNVRFVFLSATIPNAKEFVSWVTKLHKQECHVVYTDYRPTPLEHYIYPANSDDMHLVVDNKGTFLEENFQRAMSKLNANEVIDYQEVPNKQKKRKVNTKDQIATDLFKIVNRIMQENLDPCIVFSFSKKDCEQYALALARLDFNTQEEKDLVSTVFENAMESLSEEDRDLPQIQYILPILKRGIGIHHGGLLPVLKEVLEILFQEGLIKCLFATETFSIGINMPAKTVVFTQTRKFDGQDFRWITSGEYIQMSGRAGRRGLDDKGIVIQMLDEKMAPEITKNMIYGASDPLFSSYHVSYNMVLNMLRVEDADPENLIKSSFHQFQQEQNIPALLAQVEALHEEAESITVENFAEVDSYYQKKELLDGSRQDINLIIRKSGKCIPYLQAGRVLKIAYEGYTWGWGTLIRYEKGSSVFKGYSKANTDDILGVSKSDSKLINEVEYILYVLIHVKPLPVEKDSAHFKHFSDFSKRMNLIPCTERDNESAGDATIMRVSLAAVQLFTAVKLNLPKDLTRESAKRGILRAMRSVPRRFEGGIPLLDPVDDMGITDSSLKGLLDQCKELEEALTKSSFNSKRKDFSKLLSLYTEKKLILDKASTLSMQAKESRVVSMSDELTKMKRVLRELTYIAGEGVLGPKGRFSCELTTGDELVLTDMVFDGFFSDLSQAQAVAILSCFVFKESMDLKEPPKIPSVVEVPYQKLERIVRNVARVSADCGIALEEDDYLNTFNPGMMQICCDWCKGESFAKISASTEIFEGTIIRVIRRLDELLRQMASAALAIGYQELTIFFEEAANKIRRGVIFSASLYI